jgi:hypothetical protein
MRLQVWIIKNGNVFFIQVDVRELTVSHIDTITSSLGSQLRLQLATQVNTKTTFRKNKFGQPGFFKLLRTLYRVCAYARLFSVFDVSFWCYLQNVVH